MKLRKVLLMVERDPLLEIQTPSLVLDERRMMANIARFQKHADALGVRARPHMKTAKSIDVAHRQLARCGGAVDVAFPESFEIKTRLAAVGHVDEAEAQHQ